MLHRRAAQRIIVIATRAGGRIGHQLAPAIERKDARRDLERESIALENDAGREVLENALRGPVSAASVHTWTWGVVLSNPLALPLTKRSKNETNCLRKRVET
jgi:hypothetical protein